MLKVTYELMEEAGVINKTLEEMIEEKDQFGIGLAVDLLKKGHKIARKGWNGKNMYLELQIPDENSKMTLPYVYMKTADGHFVPWLASQTDLLAEDYFIVK